MRQKRELVLYIIKRLARAFGWLLGIDDAFLPVIKPTAVQLLTQDVPDQPGYQTCCNTCHQPIKDGDHIARTTIGSQFPFTHFSRDCRVSAHLYYGMWHEGRPLPHNDLSKEDIPESARAALEPPYCFYR